MSRKYIVLAHNSAYRHTRRSSPLSGAVKTFSYKPLSGTQIRLLRIKSANGRVRCQLRTVYLSECPRYHALSYVWGNHMDAQVAEVNGAPFLITYNLYEALKTFRDLPPNGLLSAPFWLWVDAICINQNDTSEKSRQIPRLGDIYSAADRVIIWLSSYIGWTSFEEQMIHQGLFCPQGNTQWLFYGVGNKSSLTKKEFTELSLLLELFTGHMWFRRTWTVQEAVLARKSPVFLHIFEHSIGTATLDLLHGMARKTKYFGKSRILQQWATMRKWARDPHRSADLEVRDPGSMILILLIYTRMRTSSIPHDRIYGLYCLLQVMNTRFPDFQPPVVDYSLPYGQVCTDITRLIIEHTRNSNIITTASVGHRVPGAPTWVSDFYECLRLKVHLGVLDSWDCPEISDDGQVLMITANITDSCEVIVPLPGDNFERGNHNQVLDHIEDIERAIIRPIAVRRSLDQDVLWSALLGSAAFESFVQVRLPGFDSAEWLDYQQLERVGTYLDDHFFATKDGWVGCCGEGAPCQAGDTICLRHDEAPIIIRRVDDFDTYEVIGKVDSHEDELNRPVGKAFSRIQLI
ncbi:heterokaryon incompatibility protein [Colletotrichum kahawae]|uniref:Heterokaryon incompatibility protein n=1 Tax=Colletotrichum kahawae TaxID=34407 RepID=A0AAE0D4F5_COLKA|nr:heterokaryon incompatibility protein [Colletotrichum kahawae]